MIKAASNFTTKSDELPTALTKYAVTSEKLPRMSPEDQKTYEELNLKRWDLLHRLDEARARRKQEDEYPEEEN